MAGGCAREGHIPAGRYGWCRVGHIAGKCVRGGVDWSMLRSGWEWTSVSTTWWGGIEPQPPLATASEAGALIAQ